jgi:hypothetical protein
LRFPRASLVRAIVRSLRATKDGTLDHAFFLDLIRRGFSAEEAQNARPPSAIKDARRSAVCA